MGFYGYDDLVYFDELWERIDICGLRWGRSAVRFEILLVVVK